MRASHPGSELESPHEAYESPAHSMITPQELDLASPMVNTPEEIKCVLLVEDDPALRRYLEVVLERAGYAVVSAGDGLEAMKFLLSTRVDVIVTDALMPNLDGYELCRFVRNSPHLAHLPVILLSALDPKNTTDESWRSPEPTSSSGGARWSSTSPVTVRSRACRTRRPAAGRSRLATVSCSRMARPTGPRRSSRCPG